MSNEPMKMHYTRDNLRTACNNSSAAWKKSFTRSPAEVTCKTCKTKLIDQVLEDRYEDSTTTRDD